MAAREPFPLRIKLLSYYYLYSFGNQTCLRLAAVMPLLGLVRNSIKVLDWGIGSIPGMAACQTDVAETDEEVLMESEVVRIDGSRMEEDLKSGIVATHEVDEFWASSLGISTGQAESKRYPADDFNFVGSGVTFGTAANFSVTCVSVPKDEHRNILFAVVSLDFITTNRGTSGPGGALGPELTVVFKDAHDGVIWEWVVQRFSQGCRINQHYGIQSEDQPDFYSLIAKVQVRWSTSYWITC